MFFMESVLVPPIKFRPAAKAGDAVSVLLKSSYLNMSESERPFLSGTSAHSNTLGLDIRIFV